MTRIIETIDDQFVADIHVSTFEASCQIHIKDVTLPDVILNAMDDRFIVVKHFQYRIQLYIGDIKTNNKVSLTQFYNEVKMFDLLHPNALPSAFVQSFDGKGAYLLRWFLTYLLNKNILQLSTQIDLEVSDDLEHLLPIDNLYNYYKQIGFIRDTSEDDNTTMKSTIQTLLLPHNSMT